MESNRPGYSVRRAGSRHRQAGITLIGLLLLAVVFGTMGLAVLKIFPLYMEKMRVGEVLSNIERDLAAGGNTAESIRLQFEQRLYVENLNADTFEKEIRREGQGYTLRVSKQSEAPFFADLFFVVKIDEQVELPR